MIERRSRGFTLIELVVVLTLVGLLVAIAAPRYFHVIDKGKESVQRQNLTAMRDAIDKFFGDLGRYPNDLDELVTQRYLREIPVDPLTEKRDWQTVAPSDSKLGSVYDVRSAGPTAEDPGTGQPPVSPASPAPPAPIAPAGPAGSGVST